MIVLKTIPLLAHFHGEDDPMNHDRWCHPRVVEYLQPKDREGYRLRVRNGKLYDTEGGLFDTRNAMSVHSDRPRAIFVLTVNGTVYASKRQLVQQFHHSSLVAGAPVAAAGEIEVEEGVLKVVSNKSGHYQPSGAHVDQILALLAEEGVDVSGVTREYLESA